MNAILSARRTDSALVRRVLSGKRNDFGILVQRHVNAVQAVAMAYVGPSPDADDIAQEAFIKALEKLDTLHDLDKFRSWLLSIVRRLCLDAKRAQASEATSDTKTLENVAVVSLDQGREELRQILLGRIYALEPNAREVLLLHYYAGFSTREIAAELEITQEAVKKRLQRARETLSQDLSEDLRELLTPEKSPDVHATRIATALAVVSVPWMHRTAAASLAANLTTATVAWIAGAALVVLTVVGWQSLRDPSTPTSPAEIGSGRNPAPAPPPPTPLNPAAAVAASSGTDENQNAQIVVASAAETDSSEPVGDQSALSALGSIMATAVTATNQPVKGVTIVAERIDWEPYETPPSSTLVRQGQTDEHGRYFFFDLPLGDYVVRALGENAASIGLAQLGVGSFTQAPRLYLQPSVSFSGRVVNEAGAPVPNAYLYTYGNTKDPQERYLMYRSAAREMTDNEGRFSFSHLTRDQWKFYVVAEGYAVHVSDYIAVGGGDAELVLTAGKTAAISVVDEQGVPLQGIQVQLAARDAYRDRRQSKTDSDGTAFFTNLRDAEYLATLADVKYASTGSSVSLDVADGKSTAGLTAHLSGSVSGTVTLADGTPLPDVFIRAAPPENSGFNPVTTTTDSEGRYTLGGLSEAAYAISPRHYDGFVFISDTTPTAECKPGKRIEDMHFEFSDSASVSGTVIDAAGKPVSDAEVRLSAGYSRNVVQTTVLSGARGSFAFRGLRPGGQYYVWAKTDTQLSAPIGPMALNTDAKEPVSIRIADPASLSGKVVDQDGRPANGVGVMASAKQSISHSAPATSTQQASLGNTTTQAAADGSFTISGLHGGDYSIQVANPDDHSYKFSNIRSLALEPGENRSDLAVVWEDTRGTLTITGRVVDRLGQAIARASVSARPQSYQDFFSAQTDANGYFTLTKLRDGNLDVYASHGRYSAAAKMEVLAGTSGLNIVLQDRGDLSLHVVDAASGSPLAQFEYGIGTSRITILIDGFKKATPDNGAFRLPDINAGDQTVLIRADGYAEQTASVRVLPRNEGESSATIQLVPAARIDALVTDPDGNPLSQALVSRDYFVQDPQGRSPYMVGTTDAAGRLLIDHLGTEPCDFYVHHAKFSPMRVQITPIQGDSRKATWVLQPGGTVSGRLLHDGAPAGGTWVSVMLGDEHFQFTMGVQTGADGTFKINRIPAGTYELWTQWRPEDNMYFRWDSNTVKIEAGRDTTLDVNMSAGSGALKGRYVVDSDTPVRDMYVILNYADGTGGYQFSTHPDGEFHLENMPPGTLTGEARFTEIANEKEHRVLLESITIRKDETTPLEINLRH